MLVKFQFIEPWLANYQVFSKVPVVVKMANVFAPKLVAISMGWIDKENMMSVIARATMNTSLEDIFLNNRRLFNNARKMFNLEKTDFYATFMRLLKGKNGTKVAFIVEH